MKTSAAILALIVGAAPSWACDHFWVGPTAEDEVFAWDIIFNGQVVDVRWQERAPRSLLDWSAEDSEYDTTDISDIARCVVIYRVTENFKGADSPFYELNYIHYPTELCSLENVVNYNELLVAHLDVNGEAFAGICDWPYYNQDELRATARRLRTEMLIW